MADTGLKVSRAGENWFLTEIHGHKAFFMRRDGYICRQMPNGEWGITPNDEHEVVLCHFAQEGTAMDYWDATYPIWEDDCEEFGL